MADVTNLGEFLARPYSAYANTSQAVLSWVVESTLVPKNAIDLWIIQV